MNTRESLADSEFRRKVETTFQNMIGENGALGKFNHQRRTEQITEKVKDDKTLEDILKNVMRKSPTLSALFLTGDRLSDPTMTAPAGSDPEFIGKEFPTYFRFKKMNAGEILFRNCEKDRELRLTFDTDAENNYFGRTKEKGRYEVVIIEDDNSKTVIQNHGMNLHNGSATLRIELPNPKVGQKIRIKILVTDNSRLEDFTNIAEVTVTPFIQRTSGDGSRRDGPSKEKGTEHLVPTGLSPPDVKRVWKSEWEQHQFDKFSALAVKQAPETEDGKSRSFDFYINADNIYLKNELKQAKGTQDLLRKQFEIGLVLIGMALIHEALIHEAPEKDGYEIEKMVADSTRAISMMLIPMIKSLGELDPSELKNSEAA